MSNTNLYKALLRAQPGIEGAIKGSKNPHFRSNYSSVNDCIDAVKESLNSVGIIVLQPVGYDSFVCGDTAKTVNWVKTVLIHAESGESTESKMELLLEKQTAQGLGSAITYGRRYTLQALCFLSALDDDGNAASGLAPQAPATQPYTPAGKPAFKGGLR